jgi:hypothetical protein
VIPSVDPTTITAPGASNPAAPNTPAAIPPNATPSVPTVGNPVTGVKPPTGSSDPNVNPFGTLYDEHTGKCVEDRTYPVNDCDTSQSLEGEAQRKNAAIKAATGDAERQRLMLELARIEAQLAARTALGNDRLADAYIGRIERSPLYAGQGKDAGLTPQEKLEFWTGLATKLKDGSLRKAEFEMLVYGSERSLPIRDRSGKIVGFREVQGGGGDASLAVFALPRWTPWAIGGAFMFGSGGGDDRRGIGLAIFAALLTVGNTILKAEEASKESSSSGQNASATAGAPFPQDPCSEGSNDRVVKTSNGRVIYRNGATAEGGISEGQMNRIQSFVNKFGQPVTVGGSRAAGTAKPGEMSDFDYFVGGNSKFRNNAERELPRGLAGGALGFSGETGIDIFNINNPEGTPRPGSPTVTFCPKEK